MREPPTEIEVRPPDPQNERGAALAPALFLILYVLSILSVLVLFRSYITDFILAILIVGLAWNRYTRILAWTGHRAGLASAISTLLVLIVIAIPTTFLAISLSREATHAYALTRDSVSLDAVEGFLAGESWVATQLRQGLGAAGVSLNPDEIQAWISNAAGGIAVFLYAQINALIANVFSLLLHFSIMMIAVFYLFIDGPRLKQWAFRLSPLPFAQEELIAQKFAAVGRAILFGNGIGSVLQGVIGAISMWLVGLPSAVLWGTVMTIFAFLPLVGISVVVIPAAAYLALEGHWLAAIGFFAFNMAQALLVENVVKTRLIGSHMQMHDLLIFMSIIGGLTVFGIVGLVYGPLFVALFLTLSELFEVDYKARLAHHDEDPRMTVPPPAT
jgi:predicted PurR-regulated permease PerM